MLDQHVRYSGSGSETVATPIFMREPAKFLSSQGTPVQRPVGETRPPWLQVEVLPKPLSNKSRLSGLAVRFPSVD
jgi:hypothetical protein